MSNIDVIAALETLQPAKATAFRQIVEQHFDRIQSALERGVSLSKVCKALMPNQKIATSAAKKIIDAEAIRRDLGESTMSSGDESRGGEQ